MTTPTALLKGFTMGVAHFLQALVSTFTFFQRCAVHP